MNKNGLSMVKLWCPLLDIFLVSMEQLMSFLSVAGKNEKAFKPLQRVHLNLIDSAVGVLTCIPMMA